MIKSGDEEKVRAETAAAQGGEETCALQRGSKEGVGSGEEITQEMIWAGVAVLDSTDFEFNSKSEIAIKIYLAMRKYSNPSV